MPSDRRSSVEEEMLAKAAEVQRQVFEKHRQFIEKYQQGELSPEVDLKVAGRFHHRHRWMNNSLQTLFTWIVVLCFPAAIAVFVWSSWWIGAVILACALVSWQVNRRWMKRLVIDCALEDPEFFGYAVEAKAIILPSSFELWGDPFSST